jgi:hypothetical protein
MEEIEVIVDYHSVDLEAHEEPRSSISTIGASIVVERTRQISEAKLSEYDAFINSNICLLGGSMEILFVAKILPYLNSIELNGVSSTSTFFKRVSKHPILWDVLFLHDFDLDYHHNRPTEETLKPPHLYKTKTNYIRRYKDLSTKIKRSKEEKHQFELNLLRQDRVTTIEKILDFTQVRLVMPLLLCSIFVSIVLFTQKVDGLPISYWVCSIPILTGVTYLAICVVVVKIMYSSQYSTTSLVRGECLQ